MRDTDRIPDRVHARRLVVSLAVFWALWGVIAVGTVGGAPGGLVALAFVVGFSSCLYFYLTLFDVWHDLLGAPAWRLLLLPSFRRGRITHQVMRNLHRPRWLWATLGATEWSRSRLSVCLGGLLLLDLLIFGVVLGRAWIR